MAYLNIFMRISGRLLLPRCNNEDKHYRVILDKKGKTVAVASSNNVLSISLSYVANPVSKTTPSNLA